MFDNRHAFSKTCLFGMQIVITRHASVLQHFQQWQLHYFCIADPAWLLMLRCKGRFFILTTCSFKNASISDADSHNKACIGVAALSAVASVFLFHRRSSLVLVVSCKGKFCFLTTCSFKNSSFWDADSHKKACIGVVAFSAEASALLLQCRS